MMMQIQRSNLPARDPRQGSGSLATRKSAVLARPASRVVAAATKQQLQGHVPDVGVEEEAPGLVVERVSKEGASRAGVSKAFTKLLGLKLSRTEDLDPETLKSPPYTAYTVPFSSLRVQKLRPYFFNRTFTDTDVGYGAFFVGMHALALIGGPLTFSWEALQLMLGGYVLTGMFGVSLSYHRQLSHKSFRCVKPLEYLFAYCGVLAFEGDPVEWSKNHRWHHLHSDSPADRHSPRDGLWHSHMGWLFDEALNSTRKDEKGNMKDSLAVPWFFKESPEFYTWIRKTYMYHQLGQALFFLGWGGLTGGLGGAVSYFIWGFVIRILFTMHMTWLVNSAVHIWGEQPYESGDGSRNNAIVALLVFGDGWHNNHHAFEYSAAHGLEWWQVDFSYYFICLLEKLGLAWDVKRPTEGQLKARRRAPQAA